MEYETDYTREGSLDSLRDAVGQKYLLASDAFELLLPFAEDVSPTFVDENTFYDTDDAETAVDTSVGGLALSGALEETQESSRDARGIVSTPPHEMIVTYAEVSDILVRALGGEASDYTAGGSGFTHDGRHDENVETLEELLGE